jgi:hypothetical protein
VTLIYSAAHPEWMGKSIDAVAGSLDVPPFEVMLRLFEDGGAGMGRITLNRVIFPEPHGNVSHTHCAPIHRITGRARGMVVGVK